MKKYLMLVSIIPLLLVSCNKKSEEKQIDKYTTKTINVNYVNDVYNTTCDIRYYNESVIPYISVSDYQKLLYRGRTYKEGRDKFEVTKNNDVYTYKVLGDYTASFDVKNNKLESDNLWCFKNTFLYYSGEGYAATYDGLPFTRVKNVEMEGTPKKVTIDFNKYNLKIYGSDKDVYVPMTFATDLFANENILQGAYNTEELFFFDYTNNESLDYFGSKYYDQIYAKPLTKEYVEYNYNELCLCYDYFQGRPGRSSLEVYYDLSNGLDAALQSRPMGRDVIKALKSTDLGTLLGGQVLLGYLRYDGGHSYYIPVYTTYTNDQGQQVRPSWLTDEVWNNALKVTRAANAAGYEEFVNFDSGLYEHEELYYARHNMLGKEERPLKGNETYTKDGDIAYIHIDGFMNEIYQRDEWDKYYKGETNTIPFGDNKGGAVGAITNGVKLASQDAEVKHLVIDLSANTGGSTDEMMFMVCLLTGDNHFYSHNTMIDTYFKVEFEFDFNFDRVFDDKDKEILNLTKDMDITVLTTTSAFSCGGISPIYLHDNGLFTIGNKCGGGSCSIYMQYDAFGNENRTSSPNHTVTKDKVSIDVARHSVCDYKMAFPKTTVDVNGTSMEITDYSSLYNTNALRALINEHYK